MPADRLRSSLRLWPLLVPVLLAALVYSGLRATKAVEVRLSPTLVEAVYNGDTDLFYRLLRLGADVNREHEGMRPLHAAVFRENRAVIETLLEHEADLEALNECGMSAAAFAAFKEKAGFARLLRSKGARPTMLDAILLGETEAVTRLLRAQPALIVSGPDCSTGLTYATWAAWHGDSQILRVFLERGADPDESLRHYYRSRGFNLSREQVLLLHEFEADFTQDFVGTLLHAAVREGNAEVCEALIECGVDPTIRNEFGLTPLELAQRLGQTEAAAALRGR